MFINKNHNPWQCLLQGAHLWYEGRTKGEHNAKVMECNKHTHSTASYAHVLLHRFSPVHCLNIFIFPSKVTVSWDSRLVAGQSRVQILAKARDFLFDKTITPAIQATQRVPRFFPWGKASKV